MGTNKRTKRKLSLSSTDTTECGRRNADSIREEDRRKTSQNVTNVSKNPFINYYRDYKRKHRELSLVDLATTVATKWTRLSQRFKNRYNYSAIMRRAANQRKMRKKRRVPAKRTTKPKRAPRKKRSVNSNKKVFDDRRQHETLRFEGKPQRVSWNEVDDGSDREAYRSSDGDNEQNTSRDIRSDICSNCSKDTAAKSNRDGSCKEMSAKIVKSRIMQQIGGGGSRVSSMGRLQSRRELRSTGDLTNATAADKRNFGSIVSSSMVRRQPSRCNDCNNDLRSQSRASLQSESFSLSGSHYDSN